MLCVSVASLEVGGMFTLDHLELGVQGTR